MQRDHDVHAAAGNFFIDGLADSRLQRREIARKIDDDVALLPIHRVQLDAEFRACQIGFAPAITSHAAHF